MMHPTIQELDWEKILFYAETCITDETEKNNVKAAIKTLISKLGDDFLMRAKEKEISFLWHLVFNTFWDQNKVISFANQIVELENEQNFDKIILMLKTISEEGKFYEALTLLDTACFFKKGFQVNFSPLILNFDKNPDLGIKNSFFKDEILIEVAELQDSEEQEQVQKVMNPICQIRIKINQQSACLQSKNELLNEPLKYFGRLNKLIPLKEAEELAEEIISEITNDVYKGFWHIKKEDWFDYIAYRPSFQSKAEELANALRLNINGFQGPSLKNQEFKRLRRKIRIEQKQLPKNRINIVVIWAKYEMFNIKYHKLPIDKFAKDCLTRFAHISGIFLLAKFPNESFVIPGHPEIPVLKSKDNQIYYFYCMFKDGMTEIKNSIIESIKYKMVN